jgi:hypothetical protein
MCFVLRRKDFVIIFEESRGCGALFGVPLIASSWMWGEARLKLSMNAKNN